MVLFLIYLFTRANMKLTSEKKNSNYKMKIQNKFILEFKPLNFEEYKF